MFLVSTQQSLEIALSKPICEAKIPASSHRLEVLESFNPALASKMFFNTPGSAARLALEYVPAMNAGFARTVPSLYAPFMKPKLRLISLCLLSE